LRKMSDLAQADIDTDWLSFSNGMIVCAIDGVLVLTGSKAIFEEIASELLDHRARAESVGRTVES
jgi:hypothetical protein